MTGLRVSIMILSGFLVKYRPSGLRVTAAKTRWTLPPHDNRKMSNNLCAHGNSLCVFLHTSNETFIPTLVSYDSGGDLHSSIPTSARRLSLATKVDAIRNATTGVQPRMSWAALIVNLQWLQPPIPPGLYWLSHPRYQVLNSGHFVSTWIVLRLHG